MDEQELDPLFKRIAEVVADIIPEEWLNVYLYGEVVEGAQIAYFYYQSASKGEYVYSHRIPELTGISESEYSRDLKILVDTIKELWTGTKHSKKEIGQISLWYLKKREGVTLILIMMISLR
jgi:Protein of unknown function, DUF600